MGSYTLRYVLILLTGFGVSLAATRLGQALGLRWRITAVPGGRRQHLGVVSRLGGIGIALGFWAAWRWRNPFTSPRPTLTRRAGSGA